MPSRIIREGILTSRRVNTLSSGAELFYRRLLSVADDYGRYHGHPTLLRAATFPLKMDVVTDDHITKWLTETINAQLVRPYTSDGQKYIEILDFGQKVRSKSKFPAPCEQAASILPASCQQPARKMPDVVVVEGVVVDEVTTLVADATDADKSPSNNGNGKPYSDEFEAFWSHYPRKVAKGAAFKVWKRLRKADREAAIDRVEWFAGCWRHNDPSGDRAAFIPHPATWLNARGWEDDEAAVELAARGR